MQLKVFQRFSKKQKCVLGIMISIVLFLSLLFLIRTYSIYEDNQKFSMISGNVPDQNYDLKFSFLLEDEGESTFLNEIPKDKKYLVSISCNHDAVGVWDYESWGPLITNLNQTQTKCNITFSTSYPLEKYGIHERLTRVESGLYEVSHEDADITYTDDVSAQNLLKQTEYRYAGSNPDNYVWFNEELWRIIGFVNTPEGQRIKIIRDESIGEYSWDTSESNVNDGWGVNEWSQSKLMNLLNNGAYYNRTSGTCYNGRNNATIDCDFRETGLTSKAKEMIDMVTWNLGGFLLSEEDRWNFINEIYNRERSIYIGKTCSDTSECNDNISRTITWEGQIGLMYPSDYGYSTSNENNLERNNCLNNIHKWNEDRFDSCTQNNWLWSLPSKWTISPVATGWHANSVMDILEKKFNKCML